MTSDALPRTRLFVDTPLAAGQPVPLSDAQTHRLRGVLRLEAGAAIRLFNPRDGEWRARLGNFRGNKDGHAVADERIRPPEPVSDLWLCFAPVKKDAVDAVVEKGTELGAAVLQPVFTRFTDVQRVNLDRLRAHAVAAAEQCERLDVPELLDPVGLDALLAGWPAGRTLLVCAEAGTARPIAEAAAEASGPAALLVGPEGGFAPAELDALIRHEFVRPVGLGPRILRADTAAIAALAVWQMLAGDGRGRPPHRV
ncbi:16S rRNA (uracil(1498)-N(3))-methyltransferase [Inquilinus sp. NPDC058860]|uniref:16S rRNA (uracil(1498)-N(3))-methyltransferase n=1 Tax=Inquilinus sp. NPDC058860 TaxID=3346652 RepID=UPI00367903C7